MKTFREDLETFNANSNKRLGRCFPKEENSMSSPEMNTFIERILNRVSRHKYAHKEAVEDLRCSVVRVFFQQSGNVTTCTIITRQESLDPDLGYNTTFATGAAVLSTEDEFRQTVGEEIALSRAIKSYVRGNVNQLMGEFLEQKEEEEVVVEAKTKQISVTEPTTGPRVIKPADSPTAFDWIPNSHPAQWTDESEDDTMYHTNIPHTRMVGVPTVDGLSGATNEIDEIVARHEAKIRVDNNSNRKALRKKKPVQKVSKKKRKKISKK